MKLDELKSIFQSYCSKDAGSPEKKLFGMEYENFVMVPKGDDKAKNLLHYQLKVIQGFSRFWKIWLILLKKAMIRWRKCMKKKCSWHLKAL